MNAMPLAASRPLLEMLGARWMVGARAAGVAWDGAAGLVAFGLSDGSLAVARLAWDGGPTVRARGGGGVELVPPSAPPPAVARIPVHAGACVALAADPDGGFLSGGADGQLARVQADGVIDTLAHWPSVTAGPLASGRGGWRVCAAGREVMRLGSGSRRVTVPANVEAIAVAPDGSRAAIAHDGGVTLWAGGDTARTLAVDGVPVMLAWSPDAQRLACSTRDGDVWLWEVATGVPRKIDEGRFAPRSLAFTADGTHLVTGASGAVACWNLASFVLESCGVGSRDAVLQLATHPGRPLVAAGYANGAVLICRPAATEVVFVRGADAVAIDVLAWSPDGEALAYGTAGGEIGLVLLPAMLFRDEGSRAA